MMPRVLANDSAVWPFKTTTVAAERSVTKLDTEPTQQSNRGRPFGITDSVKPKFTGCKYVSSQLMHYMHRLQLCERL